ncbi:S8 family peptidase [Streptomyces sp. NPDC001889]
MTGPATAAGERAGSPAGASADRAGSGERGAGRVKHRVTLITGDTVLLDAKGRVASIQRAKGRENIPIETVTAGGRTHVVPADANRLIAEGRLDRRLFDVTGLSTAESRAAYRDGLKVIVRYRGGAAKAARAEVRATDDTRVRRTLASLNADALTAPGEGGTGLWEALTRSSNGARTTASGISGVWLDAVRRASLDKSVGQIGAPAAWAAGSDGTGVRIAVLDTGVHADHGDLKGQVLGAKNFTGSPDTRDRVGHGTHVAATAAGTGAGHTGKKYRGVAPGAKILSGKVLDDDGWGDESGIIAGIDWAVAQGADIVNLSLGGYDTPELDPLEAHVNQVSDTTGVLFAVAAGNDGPDAGTVSSPGSAEAALTVGAVDDKDVLAEFSSVGPRTGDGAIKPDVTGPGVGITAASSPKSLIAQEYGENPKGYVSVSGTSMATPHVAGAAALLKQRNPGWRAKELKGVLTASAKGGKYSAFQQGSGRVAVDRAITQTVFAEPVSVGLGVQQWPHHDDTPVTERLTYRNLGTADVTLALTATTLGPDGKAAPAGFFTLDASSVTVPAGGTASVGVTADTRLGGKVDGHYSAAVTATGGGQTVRTAAAVERESEAYDVTVKHLGRDGAPTGDASTVLYGIYNKDGWSRTDFSDPSGSKTLRVRKGAYTLRSINQDNPASPKGGIDLTVQPKLTVDRKLTVTVDARKAKPVDITVPDAKAKPSHASVDYTVDLKETGLTGGYSAGAFQQLRTAHLGPQVTDGSFSQAFSGQWLKGAGAEYSILTGGAVKKFPTGHTKHYKAGELATVKAGLGAAGSTGKKGELLTWGELPVNGGSLSFSTVPTVPTTRTLYLSTGSKAKWELDYGQIRGLDSEGEPIYDASYVQPLRSFAPGKSYATAFNTGVHGPLVDSDNGVFREDNVIYGMLPVFADGQGHPGWSEISSARTTLHKGKTKVGENKDPLTGDGPFAVGAADAQYTLATSVKRDTKLARVAGRIEASWTFRSKKVTGKLVQLPISTVRFGAKVALDGTAPAGKYQTVPLTVQGPAAGKGLKSLTVHTSYDSGKTWKKVTVTKGTISVKNPAKGKGISLRAAVTDTKGNKGSVSVHNAYFGK